MLQESLQLVRFKSVERTHLSFPLLLPALQCSSLAWGCCRGSLGLGDTQELPCFLQKSKQRVPQLFDHCLCAFGVLLALPPYTPCPPAALPCALCPAQSCAACGVQASLPSPWGRSHLARPWDPGDVSVNTCTLAPHSALGQPCEPWCCVPSAPSAPQGPGMSCLGTALLRCCLALAGCR